MDRSSGGPGRGRGRVSVPLPGADAALPRGQDQHHDRQGKREGGSPLGCPRQDLPNSGHAHGVWLHPGLVQRGGGRGVHEHVHCQG